MKIKLYYVLKTNSFEVRFSLTSIFRFSGTKKKYFSKCHKSLFLQKLSNFCLNFQKVYKKSCKLRNALIETGKYTLL